jgi:hypothetical protein
MSQHVAEVLLGLLGRGCAQTFVVSLKTVISQKK